MARIKCPNCGTVVILNHAAILVRLPQHSQTRLFRSGYVTDAGSDIGTIDDLANTPIATVSKAPKSKAKEEIGKQGYAHHFGRVGRKHWKNKRS